MVVNKWYYISIECEPGQICGKLPNWPSSYKYIQVAGRASSSCSPGVGKQEGAGGMGL
jgi:hypothetical protein